MNAATQTNSTCKHCNADLGYVSTEHWDRFCSNACETAFRTNVANFKIGDGASIQIGSDCYAGTIIKITARTMTVQYDRVHKGTLFTADPNGETMTFRVSKHGNWKNGNFFMRPGRRFHDMDPSF